MFSISELACASSSGSAFTSTAALGMSSAACLSSARATRALMHFLRIGPASITSIGGGSGGRSLYATAGSNFMYEILRSIDRSTGHVDAIDKWVKHVEKRQDFRHICSI